MSDRTTHVRARLINHNRLLILGDATANDAARDDVYPVTYPHGARRRAPVEGDEVGLFHGTALAPEADTPRPERRRDPAVTAQLWELRAAGMVR